MAQELYDGQGRNVITYPRTETRYLPESLIPNVPRIVAGLRTGRAFGAISVHEAPIIHRGASSTFHDRSLAEASHYAVIPDFNTVDGLRDAWPRLSSDEQRLFDVIACSYLAAIMPDFRYRQTTVTLDVRGHLFRAAGRQPIELGWLAAFRDWQPADEKGEDAQLLSSLRHDETALLRDAAVQDKETSPPRYNEGMRPDLGCLPPSGGGDVSLPRAVADPEAPAAWLSRGVGVTEEQDQAAAPDAHDQRDALGRGRVEGRGSVCPADIRPHGDEGDDGCHQEEAGRHGQLHWSADAAAQRAAVAGERWWQMTDSTL